MYWSIQHCVLKCPWIQPQYLSASISHLAGLMLRISCIDWRLGCGLEWCLEKMEDHQLIYKHLWQWPYYSHVAWSNNILEEHVPMHCSLHVWYIHCDLYEVIYSHKILTKFWYFCPAFDTQSQEHKLEHIWYVSTTTVCITFEFVHGFLHIAHKVLSSVF